jgi:hypothetical protein
LFQIQNKAAALAVEHRVLDRRRTPTCHTSRQIYLMISSTITNTSATVAAQRTTLGKFISQLPFSIFMSPSFPDSPPPDDSNSHLVPYGFLIFVPFPEQMILGRNSGDWTALLLGIPQCDAM